MEEAKDEGEKSINEKAIDWVSCMFGMPDSSEWSAHWHKFVQEHGVEVVNETDNKFFSQSEERVSRRSKERNRERKEASDESSEE